MIPLPKNMNKPKVSSAVEQITSSNDETLTVDELLHFMKLHGFHESGLAEFLGVTKQAVNLWIKGQRDINMTMTKVIRLMQKYPHLMKEF